MRSPTSKTRFEDAGDPPDELTPEWFEDWFSDTFPEDAYAPFQVWTRLRISKDRVYRAIAYGDLDAFRLGSRWTIPRPALRAWLLDNYSLNV
jgi:excisionase family DNA binding protein